MVPCPRCRKKSAWEGNAFRPFCSERCKLIELGQWLDGAYRIETEDSISEIDGEAFNHRDPDDA